MFLPGFWSGFSLSRVVLHRSGRLLLSGSSGLVAALPVLSGCALRRSLAVRRAVISLHPVSSRSAGHFGSDRTVSPFVVLPRQLVGSGVSPYFACCPTSSVLKRSSFGISASGFRLSLRDGVTLPGRVCLSPRSDRRLLLHLPGVWLESSRWGHPVGSWFVPDLDRNEDLLAHLPLWLVSCLRDGITHFGSSGSFLRPRSERRLLPFIYP